MSSLPSQADCPDGKVLLPMDDARPLKRPRNSTSAQRVVLLLDLDAFYSQCECRRLGWDASETPLALLQWNSVLAVTYPARQRYGIKRGDSWEAVASKSKGACHAVHVALRSTASMDVTDTFRDGDKQQSLTEPAQSSLSSSLLNDNTQPTESLQQDYARLYEASPEQQVAWRKADVGRRRYSTEGKACIERYRIASAVIFRAVQAWRAQQQDKLPSLVLERASIDEFFLDVTQAVHADSWWEARAECRTLPSGTSNVGHNLLSNDRGGTTSSEANAVPDGLSSADHDSNETSAYLIRGAWLAYWIRQHIHTKLGFTLSAGISINKTIAKLSASYGKPNGQAVTFAGESVDALLEATPIRKCRHLGGKLGQAVTKLLPSHVDPTVGNIRRHLSLPQLQDGLPGKMAESARWVFCLAQGQDDEPVHGGTTTDGTNGIVKSITAFKSFPTGRAKGLTLEEAADWIRLLAEEIVTRVERDAPRNHRYPRACTVHYTTAGGGDAQSRSVRISFPPSGLSSSAKVNTLVQVVPRAVTNKEPGRRFGRLGLAATDFVVRESGQLGMDAFLAKRGDSESASDANETASQPVGTTDRRSRPFHPPPVRPSSSCSPDRDLALALKLQADYDRENALWQKLERQQNDQGRKKKKETSGKTAKISSFFQKR